MFPVRFLSGTVVTQGLFVWNLMDLSDPVKMRFMISVADLALQGQPTPIIIFN